MTPESTRVCILGAAGRMGHALVRAAARQPGIRVTAAIEQAGHAALGRDAGENAAIAALGVPITADPVAAAADVVVDFTFHSAVPANVIRAVAQQQGYVLGTTGLTPEEKQVVLEAGTHIPIVWAPNMSLGVNILLDLVKRAAAALRDPYDIEVVEMHHRLKKDAPSGTALALAAAAAAGRGVRFEDVACYGREGLTGERPAGQIAVHALRGGDVVGDHTVIFATDGERVEITHKASSRECLASGALQAARWVHGKAPGIYSMRDVLGLDR